MIWSVTRRTMKIAATIITARMTTKRPMPTASANRSRRNDSRLRSANRSVSRRMPPRLWTAYTLSIVSSMALVVAAPAARLAWLVRRTRAEAGKVTRNASGKADHATHTSSGAT